MEMIISHIVACSENRVIGRKGTLPWHLPEDLKLFKEKTTGHGIIMGRKTFESIGRPLPKRLNIVITRQSQYQQEGVVICEDVSSAIDYCRSHTDQWGKEIFIVGGGDLFLQTLPLVQRIYLTQIHQQIEGDIFYPPIDLSQFKETSRVNHIHSLLPFSFITLERVSNQRPDLNEMSFKV